MMHGCAFEFSTFMRPPYVSWPLPELSPLFGLLYSLILCFFKVPAKHHELHTTHWTLGRGANRVPQAPAPEEQIYRELGPCLLVEESDRRRKHCSVIILGASRLGKQSLCLEKEAVVCDGYLFFFFIIS